MIAALKAKGVPVLWVGLPAVRGTKSTSDMSYLDELYRERAEKAGITYVDIWDGFVDEQGRYAVQGPDFEGQIRRLRTADGVHFTKAGAVKLASYVDRELRRVMSNHVVPVALPGPADMRAGQSPALPGGPTSARSCRWRPAAARRRSSRRSGRPAPGDARSGRGARCSAAAIRSPRRPAAPTTFPGRVPAMPPPTPTPDVAPPAGRHDAGHAGEKGRMPRRARPTAKSRPMPKTLLAEDL